MRYLAVILVLFTLSCSSTQGRPHWPELLECGPTTGELIGLASAILYMGGDFKQALAELARDKGPDVLLCVVEQLHRKWAHLAQATPQLSEALANARAFLEDAGTDISWAE